MNLPNGKAEDYLYEQSLWKEAIARWPEWGKIQMCDNNVMSQLS